MSNRPSERADVRRLQDEIARYRDAAEKALEQLDHCIGYFERDKASRGLAGQLRKTRRSIEQRMRSA